jgi:hypothetical protein
MVYQSLLGCHCRFTTLVDLYQTAPLSTAYYLCQQTLTETELETDCFHTDIRDIDRGVVFCRGLCSQAAAPDRADDGRPDPDRGRDRRDHSVDRHCRRD